MASTPKDLVIEKIRKLINLASSANLKEAERAAFKACALIREHSLDVCDPDVLDGIYQSQAQLEDQVRRLEAATPEKDDWWSVSGKTGGHATGYGGVYHGTQHVGTQPYVTPPPKYTAKPKPPQAPTMSGPINLKDGAKFDSNCLQCGGHIKVGDPALWQRAVGTWHQTTDCYQKWLAGKAATAAFDPFATP